MSDDLYGRLARRFDIHKTVNKGGSDQTYVPAADVIERLNKELGLDGWSFVVVREGFTATEAWVLGELTVTIDGVQVKRQQYGNEPITMGRTEKATGDLLKKAGTDALKKCATLVGVAAYLYDEDERREVQAEMREQARNGNRPPPKPAEKPAPLANVTPIREGATTPPAGAASPTSSGKGTAASDGGEKPLKTKAQLVDDMNRGIAMARSLGLEPADVDPATMNRADIESVIKELARQIKIVKAAKAGAAS